jgi:hypothetical protein
LFNRKLHLNSLHYHESETCDSNADLNIPHTMSVCEIFKAKQFSTDVPGQNNFNEPDTQSRSASRMPPSSLNIPPSDSASRCDDTDLTEVAKVMRDAAAEAQVEAERAIDGMKKDKELWNRVQQLKDARQAKHGSGENNVDSDHGNVCFHFGQCTTSY